MNSSPRAAGRILLLMVSALALPVAVWAASISTPESLIAAIERAVDERQKSVRSVTADVVVELSAPTWKGAATCEGRLLALRPGAMRLRGYGALSTVFDAATDGKRFGLYVPSLEYAVTGAAGQESLLTQGLPILPGEIVAALFGEPYGALDQPLRVLSVEPEAWVATTLPDGHEMRARYRRDPVLIEKAELWTGAGTSAKRVARLEYRDYRKRRGVWWPTRIEFDWPGQRGRLALEFTSVSFNEQVAQDAFELSLPSGVPTIDLSQLAPAPGQAPRPGGSP